MRVHPILARSLVVALSVGCSSGGLGNADGGSTDGATGSPKDSLNGPGGADVGPAVPTGPAIVGVVLDTDGAPVSGASLEAGAASALANGKGEFALEVVASGEVSVRVTAPGYVRTSKRVTVHDGPTRLDVRMIAEAAAVEFDSDVGGTVGGPRGASATVAPGVLVDGAGKMVTGKVQVALTPLDPSTGELAAYPGDLGATTLSGERVQLESFGVLDVTIRQNGHELTIKGGETIAIRVPAPAAGTPPTTSALWSFDEATGLWKEEGVAVYDAATKTFTADIPHMSPWNIDKPLVSTCLRGVVEDEGGHPVAGAAVNSSGVDYFGGSAAVTGPDGVFCIVVRVASSVRITATHPSGGGTSRLVTSQDVVTPVPPVCGTDPCQPLDAPFVVKAGTATSTDGTQFDCAGLTSPTAGTCAEGLAAMWGGCYAPSGKCTYSQLGDGASFTIEYDNGAKSTLVTAGEVTTTTLIGASGATCGQVIFDGSASPDSPTVSFKPTGGEAYQYVQRGNDAVIVCPGGTEVTITGEAADLFQACSGGAPGANPAQTCKAPGQCETDSDCTGGQNCCDYAGSNVCTDTECADVPTQCKGDGDCTGGKTCCTVSGFSTCLDAGECPVSCAQDSDCADGNECCSFGGFTSCVATGGCPGG